MCDRQVNVVVSRSVRNPLDAMLLMEGCFEGKDEHVRGDKDSPRRRRKGGRSVRDRSKRALRTHSVGRGPQFKAKASGFNAKAADAFYKIGDADETLWRGRTRRLHSSRARQISKSMRRRREGAKN